MLFDLEGKSLEVVLTTTNAAAQAWYGYEQVRLLSVSESQALKLLGHYRGNPHQRRLR